MEVWRGAACGEGGEGMGGGRGTASLGRRGRSPAKVVGEEGGGVGDLGSRESHRRG